MGRYIYKPGLPVRVKPGVIGKLKTVVEKSASGDPVHITDAAKDLPARDLAAAIGPVQDLYGYDAPWPAGGGKNLLPVGDKAGSKNHEVTFTPNGDGTYNVSGTSAQTVNWNIWDTAQDIPSFLNGAKLSGGANSDVSVSITYYEDDTWKGAQFSNPSEISLSVPEGANKYQVGIRFDHTDVSYTGVIKPMIRLASSADDTWAPYENICPITGRTGVKVTRTGKNLLPNEITQAVTERDVTFEPTDDGGIYIHGINSGNLWQTNICQNLSLKAGEYIISIGNNLPTNGLVQITNRANNYVYCSILSSETYKNFTVTKAMENDMRVRFATSGGTGIEFNVTVYPMIRLASIDDADFEPYQGKTVTVDLDGTIYGGEYDVTTGVLTVTHKAVDMGSISWYLVTNYTYTGFRGDVSDMVATVELGSYPIMCSYYPQVSARGIGTYLNASNDKTICRRNNDKNIMVQDTAYATVDAFKTAVAGQTVVYELASPFTVQLTAGEEVRMLGGENNLWADTGSVRLDYYGDIQ